MHDEVGPAHIADVLPLRPRRKHLESLTSYIMRLCQLFRIKSMEGVAALFFTFQSVRVIRNLGDYPPLILTTMSRTLQMSEEELLRATFYFLGSNFGRT